MVLKYMEMLSNSRIDPVLLGELLPEVSRQRQGGCLGMGWGDSGNRIQNWMGSPMRLSLRFYHSPVRTQLSCRF